MAADSTEAWNAVGARFGEWSKILGERYRQRGEELGGTPEEDRKKLEEAVSTVTRQLDQAFTSLGEHLRDPEANQRLKEAGKALGDAIAATVSDVGDQVKKTFGSGSSSS
jgi:hypothetical protein